MSVSAQFELTFDIATPAPPKNAGPKAKRPVAADGFAVCFGRGGCGQTKAVESFRIVKGATNTLCKACVSVAARSYHKENVSHEQQRENFIKWRYGMTMADWKELYAYQGGRCFTCERPEAECPPPIAGKQGNRAPLSNLVVEHDHLTGKVRALTCQPCNTLIGQLELVPTVLRARVATAELLTYLACTPAAIIGVGQRGHHTEKLRAMDHAKLVLA